MVSFMSIVLVVVIVILYILIFKLIKSIAIFKLLFRFISLAFLAVLVVGAILIFSVIEDANDFRKNFENSTNLAILKDQNNFLVGASMYGGEKPLTTLTADQLGEMEKNYLKNESITDEKKYYKTIVFDMKAIDDISQKAFHDDSWGIDLTKDDMKKILASDSAKKTAAELIAKKKGISVDSALEDLPKIGDQEIKTYIFSYALSYYFNPGNFDKLSYELKQGNIGVYEETAMFKAMKYTPLFLIKSIVGKNQSITNSTAQDKTAAV